MNVITSGSGWYVISGKTSPGDEVLQQGEYDSQGHPETITLASRSDNTENVTQLKRNQFLL